MRALSVRQPWAGLIAEGTKTVEARTWSTRHRGPLLICAGQSFDRTAAASLAARGLPLPTGPQLTGVALAVVDVVDCHPDVGCCRPWGPEGGFHWSLADPERLAEPFPVTGRLGLFDVEDVGWSLTVRPSSRA